jgi:homoserine O-acetyltransferase
MDLFDVRDHALPSPCPPLVFVGIGNDWLFPLHLVRAAAGRYAGMGAAATYLQLDSTHGHDAFLAESDALAELLSPHFLARHP